MPQLTASQLTFVKAVADGRASQLRHTNPYKTYIANNPRAVAKTVLDAVADLVEVDFTAGTTWEKPYRLTDAGKRCLAEHEQST